MSRITVAQGERVLGEIETVKNEYTIAHLGRGVRIIAKELIDPSTGRPYAGQEKTFKSLLNLSRNLDSVSSEELKRAGSVLMNREG